MAPRRSQSGWTTGALRACAFAIALAPGCRRVDDDAPPSGESRLRPDPGEPGDGVRTAASHSTIVVPDFAAVASRVGPSVVTVIATVREPEGETKSKILRGVGSGMIVDAAAGHVLTNEHVVSAATRVEVELADRERVTARVVFADDMLDLALLQLVRTPPELQAVVFADRSPRPGEWVMAVGQPFGLGHTVTVGVISGQRRDHDDLGRPEGLRPDGIWSFIQTDASINVGNSGGPLVDVDGRVVGITTAVRRDGQGLAFAVPGEMALRFLDEVRTHGRVRRARLGISAENVVEHELPGHGEIVRVTKVDADGPAARAGIAVGDIVLAIDSEPVRRVSDVAYITQLRGAGTRMSMTIQRGSEPAADVLVIADAG
jgi:S1-C subfamily serine protease